MGRQVIGGTRPSEALREALREASPAAPRLPEPDTHTHSRSRPAGEGVSDGDILDHYARERIKPSQDGAEWDPQGLGESF